MIDAARLAFLATCPEPLVPPDCDLRDFAYMPLFVSKLRRSETWANARYAPEEGFYCLNLWMSSWHELPASSLEVNEATLAEAAMCDRSRWAIVRDQVLKGWVLCSDGRLYHPVVAKFALEAWATRKKYRDTMALARGAKAAKAEVRQPKLDLSAAPSAATSATLSASPPVGQTVPEEIVSATPLDTEKNDSDEEQRRKSAVSSMIDLKEKVKVKEKVERKQSSLRSPHATRACGRVCDDPAFDKFIRDYPVPQSPRFARIEWDAALERGVDPADILAGLAQHRFADNPRFIKHPAGWLAGECWRSPGVPAEQCSNGYLEIIRRAAEESGRTLIEGAIVPMVPDVGDCSRVRLGAFAPVLPDVRDASRVRLGAFAPALSATDASKVREVCRRV